MSSDESTNRIHAVKQLVAECHSVRLLGVLHADVISLEWNDEELLEIDSIFKERTKELLKRS